MKRKDVPRALLLPALFGAGQALAAGGHHAVDDAVILSHGECGQESWLSRAQDGERLLHAGINCRAGPVELGFAGEHAHTGERSATAWNAELKWAHEIAGGLSAGIDLQGVWLAQRHPRYAATRFAALATWSPDPALSVHVNLGRDFIRSEPDVPHHGVGIDWTPVPRWTFTAERFVEARTHSLRAGVRWAAGRAWTVDLSYAQRLSGPVPSLWTIGLTLDLDGD